MYKKRDREIVEEIAKANGLFCQIMNCRESENFERALAIYDEYALAYGYNVNIFNEFEKKLIQIF